MAWLPYIILRREAHGVHALAGYSSGGGCSWPHVGGRRIGGYDFALHPLYRSEGGPHWPWLLKNYFGVHQQPLHKFLPKLFVISEEHSPTLFWLNCLQLNADEFREVMSRCNVLSSTHWPTKNAAKWEDLLCMHQEHALITLVHIMSHSFLMDHHTTIIASPKRLSMAI